MGILGEMYYRNFLMQLGRLRSLTICRLHAGNPRKLAVSLNPWPRPENRGVDSVSPDLSLKASELGAPISKSRQRWASRCEQRASSRFLCIFVRFKLSMDGREHLLHSVC